MTYERPHRTDRSRRVTALVLDGMVLGTILGTVLGAIAALVTTGERELESDRASSDSDTPRAAATTPMANPAS